MLTGAFTERLRNSWVEIRENLGRATLQTLGVMLGVAAVLGGFSISDSQRLHLPFANWAGTVYHGMPEALYEFSDIGRATVRICAAACLATALTS